MSVLLTRVSMEAASMASLHILAHVTLAGMASSAMSTSTSVLLTLVRMVELAPMELTVSLVNVLVIGKASYVLNHYRFQPIPTLSPAPIQRWATIPILSKVAAS